MAVAFRNVQTNVNPASTTNVVTKPTGTADGDILVLRVGYDPGGVNFPTTITPPSGFTEVSSGSGIFGTWTQKVYWKLAGGSEPANYTVTFGDSCYSSVDISAFSGCDTTTPIGSGEDTVTTGTGTTSTGTGVTASRDSSMLIHYAVSSVGARTSGPSGMTNQATYDTNVYVDTLAVNNGATGNKTSTYPTSQDWVVHMVVLRPPAAGSLASWFNQQHLPQAPPVPRIPLVFNNADPTILARIFPGEIGDGLVVGSENSYVGESFVGAGEFEHFSQQQWRGPTVTPTRPVYGGEASTFAAVSTFTPAAWTGQKDGPVPPPVRTNAVRQLAVATVWALTPIIPTAALPTVETPRPPAVQATRQQPEGWKLTPIAAANLATFFDQQQQRPPIVGRTLYSESGGDNSAGGASGSIGFLAQDPPERPPAAPRLPRHEVPWTLAPLSAVTLAPFLDTPGRHPPVAPPIERGQEQAQPWGRAVL